LLDCVADMQVVYGVDNNADGVRDWWTDETGNVGATASDIRSRLLEVRVYILAQVGKRDQDYTHPATTVYVGAADVGSGRNFTYTSDQRKYRWKVYQIVVKPWNLSF
jgi:hypothetical protein